VPLQTKCNRTRVTGKRKKLEGNHEGDEEHEGLEEVEVVGNSTLREPIPYFLRVVHDDKEDATVFIFDPWDKVAFEYSNTVSDELLKEFTNQLREHFNRPSTEEVILKVHSPLEGIPLATISTKAVVTAILRGLGSKNNRYSLEYYGDMVYVSFRSKRSPLQPPPLEVGIFPPNTTPEYLALVTIYCGPSTGTLRKVLASGIVTTVLLSIPDFTLKTISKQLDEDLRRNRDFRFELGRQKKEFLSDINKNVAGAEGRTYVVDEMPKLSVMWRWDGQGLSETGQLGTEMFSVLTKDRGTMTTKLGAWVGVSWSVVRGDALNGGGKELGRGGEQVVHRMVGVVEPTGKH